MARLTVLLPWVSLNCGGGGGRLGLGGSARESSPPVSPMLSMPEVDPNVARN
jgi:hypothetical protein